MSRPRTSLLAPAAALAAALVAPVGAADAESLGVASELSGCFAVELLLLPLDDLLVVTRELINPAVSRSGRRA